MPPGINFNIEGIPRLRLSADQPLEDPVNTSEEEASLVSSLSHTVGSA